MNPLDLNQWGIQLMRSTNNDLHGYGCDPNVKVDFGWQLLSFPPLPESLLIHTAGGFREIYHQHRRYAAGLLYINKTAAGNIWELILPNQTCDDSGALRVDLKSLAIPPTARIAGMIATVSPEAFADFQPMLKTDGISIVIDPSREWIVSKAMLTVNGKAEPVLLQSYVKPTFSGHDRSPFC